MRAGKDDVSFLTGREMIDNGLTGKMIAGPTVFVETMAVMVPSDSPVQRLEQLAEHPICFALLQRAQDHLDELVRRRAISISSAWASRKTSR